MAEVRFQAKIRVQESHIAVWASVAQKLGGISPIHGNIMLKFHQFPIHWYIFYEIYRTGKDKNRAFKTTFFVHISMGRLFGVVHSSVARSPHTRSP